MTSSIGAVRSQLSFDEVAAKYPFFPKPVLLKIDLQRRGVHYTEEALKLVDPDRHQLGGTNIFGTRDGSYIKKDSAGRAYRCPEAFNLRDGTSVLTTSTPLEQNPYVIDADGSRIVIKDNGKIMEEAFYWEKPDYFDRKTSSGKLMQNVITAVPQRLYLLPNRYCHFWTDGQGCRFCDIVSNSKELHNELGVSTRLTADEVSEVIAEALKEPGRFSILSLTSGSDFRGKEAFDSEIDYYIEILRGVEPHFRTKKIPCKIICSAARKHQLQRLYDNTCVTSVTMDIEVFGEEHFNRMCPGKARWVGYGEWKRRLFDAVDIFGPGRVQTGIVSGVELIPPDGWKSEDEGLEQNLAEAEEFIRNGVSPISTVWVPRPGSALGTRHANASLEYYAVLAWEFQKLRRKHRLPVEPEDYRRCGNHPDADLARCFA